MVMSALLLPGCCIRVTTVVRNGTGSDITLTMCRQPKPPETVAIRAGAKKRVSGVMPRSLDGAADSWMVSDGRSVFTFADVSPIAAMPGAFTSSSRLTRDFPCKRLTQHVRLAPDMTIHPVRVIGYTAHEPVPFPIHYTRMENQK